MITKKDLLNQFELLNKTRKSLIDYENGCVKEDTFDQYVSIMERMQVIIDHILDLEEQEK